MRSNFDIFSDDQAITATAFSTNYVDVGEFAGKGEPIDIEAKVTEAFTNLTNLEVGVYQCDTTGGVYTEVMSLPVVLLATLVQGYRFKLNFLPDVNQRYIKLKYTVTGTAPDAGEIAAQITAPGGVDRSYEDGQYFSPRNPSGAAATA
jgi:hypothetical protein